MGDYLFDDTLSEVGKIKNETIRKFIALAAPLLK